MFAGPILAENGPGTYFVGQADYNSAPTGTKLLVMVGAQSQTYASPLLVAGTWLHVAVVRSGNVFKLYLNGTHLTPDITVNSGDSSLPGGTSTLRLGRRTDNMLVSKWEAQYYGFIDDVAVFTKALTKQEIDAVIGETDGRLHGDESGLLAAWIFDSTLPSGAALPAKLKRPLTFNSVPANKRADATALSAKRDSAFDAKLLPLPYMEVEWTLPFTTGQVWNVLWGNDSGASTHNGTSAFSWDFQLAGDQTPGKPANANGPSCGEPLNAVAAGTVFDLNDAGGGALLGNQPPIDGRDFLQLEMVAGEIATYMHTLTGSIADALATVTPPVVVGKGVPVAKVGTRTANNCHLHIASQSGNLNAILSPKTANPVTFPVCFSRYEACDVQDGADPDDEQKWYFVERGVPLEGQYVRRTRQWSGWQRLGGVIKSAPTVSSWAPGRLDVFARGQDNALWHKWWDGDSWHNWQSLGGEFKDAPAAVSWGSNRIDVFVRGMNDHLWHKWWDGSAWHAWQDLSGVIMSAPTVSSWASGRLDVFARGQDNALWHKWWDGDSWHNWQSLGGEFKDAPAAVSWGSNRIDVFVRGMNDHLWHKWWDGSTWHAWQDLAGILTSAPGVASWGQGRLDVFARGQDNALWHKWFDGDSWHNWQTLGGQFTDAPGAVSWGSNRIDVFVRGQADRLERLWWS